MTPDEVDERISKLRGTAGLSAEELAKHKYEAGVHHASVMNQQRQGNDATLYLPPEPPAAVQDKRDTPVAPPRMPKDQVIMPEGASFAPPMVLARFRAFWVDLLEKEFPGEIRQPTLAQYEAWRTEDMKPRVNRLAHTIEVTDGPVGDLSGWHGPQYRAEVPLSSNPGLRSRFANDRAR